MANLKNINVTHAKIGEVVLPADQKNNPQYNKQTIESIFSAGISILKQNKVISDSDSKMVLTKIREAKIAIHW